MSLTILSLCHTEYSDSWEYYFDTIFANSLERTDVVMAVNNLKAAEDFFAKHSKYRKITVIPYDESLTVIQRLKYILNKIKTEYIFYLADNNFLKQFSEAHAFKIMEWLTANNFQSVQFISGPEDGIIYKLDEDIFLKEIFDSYPFSFLPSLWNRDAFLTVVTLYYNVTYRCFEDEVKPFIKENYRVFRVACLGETVKCDNTMEKYIHTLHLRSWREYIMGYHLGTFQEEFNNAILHYKLNVPIEDFGFIIVRNNDSWKECYITIRKYYKDKIVIIDIGNNNDYYDSQFRLDNTEIIDNCTSIMSAYYYMYTNKLFKMAVILNDFVMLGGEINFKGYLHVKFLWELNNETNTVEHDMALLSQINASKDLIEFYNKKDLWKGCFATMTMICYGFLEKLHKKYNFLELHNMINSQEDLLALQRVFGCICTYEKPELVRNSSFFRL